MIEHRITYIEGGEDGGLQVLDVEGGDDDVGESLVHPSSSKEALNLGVQELAVVFRSLELQRCVYKAWPAIHNMGEIERSLAHYNNILT